MRFISDIPDFHYFADASAGAWLFAFSYLYIWTEGKKCFAAPILNRFYRKITQMEMGNLEIYYAENVEVRVRKLMAIARQQIDFKSLHGEYMSVRNNVLLNVLLQLFSSSSTSKFFLKTTSTREPSTSLNKLNQLKT